MPRLQDWLSQQATRNFVGRKHEIEQLFSLVMDSKIHVVFVHGISGIGKSSLLNIFSSEAQSREIVVIKLDCRAIKPSSDGFLSELNNAIGSNSNDVEQVANRLSDLGERVILALDAYEIFRMMDTWLRQIFIPLLKDSVHIVLCGREAPVAAWYTTPGWEGLFKSIQLGPLSRDESTALLLQCGVDEMDTQRVASFTKGHPLALKLAVAAIAERPDLNLKEVESQRVVSELSQLYLSHVSDTIGRVTLEAASVVRRTTRSLLSAMLPDVAPNDAYDRLQALPFVENSSDGLMIHDLVQQAISASLRSADPERYYYYRRRAWQQLRSEFSVGSRTTIWRYTADMIYLIDNPGVHDAFFPKDAHLFAMDNATSNDEAAIFDMVLRHRGEEMVDILRHWWQVQPDAFFVARGRRMEVGGFYCMLKVRQSDDGTQFSDPITSLWWQHMQSHPIPEKQISLFVICWLTAEAGEDPSPAQGLLWMDLKRTYMEYPHTRRLYNVLRNSNFWTPIYESLGFRVIEPSPVIDDNPYVNFINDFGSQLVPGWMAGLVDTQLGITPPVVLDVEARALLIANNLTKLTPLEFELMRYLIQHEEKAISRDELLSVVWGYDYTGGSNVVDGMVRSLRKKLGDYSDCIETVSGVGYKLQWR